MFRAAVAGRSVLRPGLHGWVFGRGGIRGEGGGLGRLNTAAAVGRRALFRSSTIPQRRHVAALRGFRSLVLRLALAVGGMYYYMTSSVFAEHGNGTNTSETPVFTPVVQCREARQKDEGRIHVWISESS